MYVCMYVCISTVLSERFDDFDVHGLIGYHYLAFQAISQYLMVLY